MELRTSRLEGHGDRLSQGLAAAELRPPWPPARARVEQLAELLEVPELALAEPDRDHLSLRSRHVIRSRRRECNTRAAGQNVLRGIRRRRRRITVARAWSSPPRASSTSRW